MDKIINGYNPAWSPSRMPRLTWVLLVCPHAGIVLFQSSMHKWGLAPTSICECGALDQTAANVILKCLLHSASRGLLVLDNETRSWINNIAANI